MLQRTKGRILLAALVITGMAGTPRNTTLSQEERKFCVTSLRKSRNELVSSLRDLSPAQLNFRPGKDKPTIKDRLFHIAATESMLGRRLQLAMKEPSRPEQRTAISHSDEELIRLASDPGYPLLSGLPVITPAWTSAREAIESFVNNRSSQVKYVRNTTEDLRNHVVQLGFGYIDCYQLLLVITHYSNRHLQQIKEIMQDVHFPGT